MAGESRTELLQFTNDLLGTNYNKVSPGRDGGAVTAALGSHHEPTTH